MADSQQFPDPDLERPPEPTWLRSPAPPRAITHYYGDIVRRLFLAAGVIMLVATPFFAQFLPVPAVLSLLAVLAISVAAGLTNPLQRWAMLLDVAAALIGLVVFEYHAISRFAEMPPLLFMVDQVLAVIFFFALYFSVKTVRGVIVTDYTIRQKRRALREKEEQREFPGR